MAGLSIKQNPIWKFLKMCTFDIFSVRFLSVLHGHTSGFSSPPKLPMTSDFEGFLSQILSITIFVFT